MTVEQKSVDTIRILSAEAIQRANSGHPGICMGAAPIGYELFAKHLNFSHRNPKWENRDRFVLSAGHGSMLLYSLLHLFGYDVTKEDLINFRQLGSRTPGHPEYGKTDGVETSTGPLGQGVGNAVGFAVAEAHLAALFNRPGYPVVDHYTYVLTGDGCLEEGIGYEACSFAGTQKLGKLILLYDCNDTTIEGNMKNTFSEDVATRFIAQGWQVLRVPDANNLFVLGNAIERAKAETVRPTVIICKSVIGYGSPLAGTADCHGAPLGEANLEATKQNLGWKCPPFEVPEDVKEHCLAIAEERAKKEDEWNELFARYEEAYPELAAEYKRFMSGMEPDWAQVESQLPSFDKPEATRSCGGKILNAIAKTLPNIMSGSADLAPSTKTEIKGQEYFSPEHREGCNIHFGIREHAMSAICNGIQLHGGLKAVCSTFFSFTDYMKAGIRMTALMNISVLYVMTHDSIGVGEDGPTHQPMEQLISLRSIPNINVFRPCDGSETYAAFRAAFTDSCPTVIVETRQNLPAYDLGREGAGKGAYVLADCEGTPDVLLIASGSEVEICMQAKDELASENIKAKVISMVSIEKFEQQDEEYRDSVINRDVKARVCVEAASHYSWYRYSRDYGEVIAMKSFGVSGPAKKLFEYFGFTAQNVAKAAKRSIENVKLDRFSH
ncbi:MAG TPA: transketolase [Candidatus Coproplasma excrementipullorum]|nr:transketolase [Candidatus Coproplasma excrementipullorum]